MGSGAAIGSCLFCFAGKGRRSPSLFSTYEKLKVRGENRPHNPVLQQLEMRGVMCEGLQQRGLGVRVYSHIATKIALSLDIAFFPSSLHGPQCVPPALGSWLCHLHPTWSLRGEEGQPGNTEAGRRPVKDLAWSRKGLSQTLVRGAHRSLENTRKESSQPQWKTSFQPSPLQTYLPWRWRAMMKHGPISSLPCSFYISTLKEHGHLWKEIQSKFKERFKCLTLWLGL